MIIPLIITLIYIVPCVINLYMVKEKFKREKKDPEDSKLVELLMAFAPMVNISNIIMYTLETKKQKKL